MKKLLVLMLCGMLAVSGLGLDVHASSVNVNPNSQSETTNTSEGDITPLDADEDDEEENTSNPGGSVDPIAEDEDPNSPEKIEAAKVKALKDLKDYYLNHDFTAVEVTKANSVMNEAGKKLGYKFENDAFAPNGSCVLGTVDGIESHVSKMMAKLDDCKTKAPAPAPEPEKVENNSNIIIGGKEYTTSTANAGHHCEIAVPLVNLGETDVTNVVITPALSGDVKSWPFDIEKTDYSKTCDELEGENSGKKIPDRKYTFRWNLKTRDDAVSGYTKLVFNVTYNEADGTKGSVALDYYVQVNGVEPEEENGKLSTPRVIVTGFTTTPEEVYAGDTFKLTLNLKNTSKETAVQNMLFDIQGTQEGTDANNTYAAFLPTAGSSTIFVDSIAPNSTKSISIELKSKADLAQKPYVVTVNMEYEDSKANPFTETASVSVPIKQEAKVDLSSIQVMPESINIGNEANVMFSIYNVGKTKLYNVNVKFVADSISGGDTFIGNMDPGATGNVDAYLMGQAMTMDDGTVKILISYEDEEGKEAVIEKTMTLYVSEPYYPEMYEDPMMDGMVEEQKAFPWWGYAIIGAVVAGGAAAAVLVLKKKKKAKKLALEEMELVDSLEDNE